MNQKKLPISICFFLVVFISFFLAENISVLVSLNAQSVQTPSKIGTIKFDKTNDSVKIFNSDLYENETEEDSEFIDFVAINIFKVFDFNFKPKAALYNKNDYGSIYKPLYKLVCNYRI
jgi:hypothetical protein